jgi:L-alanine-DL-glutamate epimerase-like enolase superfamily enzyme
MVGIERAEVIVSCPDRNFVTLKIRTDQGITGVGDATLNEREPAVVAYPYQRAELPVNRLADGTIFHW